MPETIRQQVEARLGVVVAEGYGLTETSPTVTSSAMVPVRPGSVGRPVPGVEVRLVGEDGRDVGTGVPGEIWVRGGNVFAGYWDDPEATAAALTPDGWLRTGDVGTVDADGYYYLLDRIKDLVIVSGFKVYPAEVEGVLLEHPGVAAAAVVAVPHPYTGEAVKAFVVPDASASIEEDDVVNFCRERLAGYKCPTKVEFVERLPDGVAGKVLRRQLRGA
jgi:long-chain acyl-CoA synthetase